MLASPIPAPGTYAAAVEFLAPDVVNAIERSLPCPEAADGRHIWDENREEVHAWGRLDTLVRVDRWWCCVHCGLTSLNHPIPVSERPYPMIRSASETYGALLDGSL